MAAVQSDLKPPAAQPAAGSPFGWRGVLAGACLAWIAFLAFLAATTANPVMLNLRQLDQSQLIVAGKVIDRTAGRIEVVEVLRGDSPADQLVVAALAGTNVQNGTTYLFPLRFTAESNGEFRFQITPPDPTTRDGHLRHAPDRLAPPGEFVWPMTDQTQIRFREYRKPRDPDAGGK